MLTGTLKGTIRKIIKVYTDTNLVKKLKVIGLGIFCEEKKCKMYFQGQFVNGS